MLSVFKFEMKVSLKQLIIWALAVGGTGMFCILLFESMQSAFDGLNGMDGLAESFASMGAFSEAFGMDRLSIATINGFFATEVGTVHSLGSAMFAAAIATVILSKEEDAHTAEFTYTLPVSRNRITIAKYLSVLVNLVVFTAICLVMYRIGFVAIGAEKVDKEFYVFMLSQLMMNLEIASICFVISAVNRKNKLGIGIALALFMYFFDLIARVVPNLKKAIVFTPLSYANATDIFLGTGERETALVIGAAVTAFCIFASAWIYNRKDLAG